VHCLHRCPLFSNLAGFVRHYCPLFLPVSTPWLPRWLPRFTNSRDRCHALLCTVNGGSETRTLHERSLVALRRDLKPVFDVPVDLRDSRLPNECAGIRNGCGFGRGLELHTAELGW